MRKPLHWPYNLRWPNKQRGEVLRETGVLSLTIDDWYQFLAKIALTYKMNLYS